MTLCCNFSNPEHKCFSPSEQVEGSEESLQIQGLQDGRESRIKTDARGEMKIQIRNISWITVITDSKADKESIRQDSFVEFVRI